MIVIIQEIGMCMAKILPRNVFHFTILMTHKYRGSIVVLSISKSVEPNEEQKVLTSGFPQGFTAGTKRKIFMGFSYNEQIKNK